MLKDTETERLYNSMHYTIKMLVSCSSSLWERTHPKELTASPCNCFLKVSVDAILLLVFIIMHTYIHLHTNKHRHTHTHRHLLTYMKFYLQYIIIVIWRFLGITSLTNNNLTFYYIYYYTLLYIFYHIYKYKYIYNIYKYI